MHSLSFLYLDKPLPQARPEEIQLISASALEGKLGLKEKGVTFSEVVDYAPGFDFKKRYLNTLLPPADPILHAYIGEQFLTKGKVLSDNSFYFQPHPDLVVCKIDDDVGHGVFTKADIPAHTILCFYASTMKASDGIVEKTVDFTEDMDNTEVGLRASTRHRRGISSLLQHFPTKECLDNAEWSNFTIREERFCLANAGIYHTSYLNKPVYLLMTTRPIKKNEQLGWDYGKKYFFGRRFCPEFFNYRTGSVLKPAGYRRRGSWYLSVSDMEGNSFNVCQDLQVVWDTVKKTSGSAALEIDTQIKETGEKRRSTISIPSIIQALLKVQAIQQSDLQSAGIVSAPPSAAATLGAAATSEGKITPPESAAGAASSAVIPPSASADALGGAVAPPISAVAGSSQLAAPPSASAGAGQAIALPVSAAAGGQPIIYAAPLCDPWCGSQVVLGLIVNKISKCAKCNNIYYCSPACQKADWPRHKKEH
jgi:hypothetical protein